MNILLIAGGWSSEREVSLSGGKIIREALSKIGHSVTFYDPAEGLDELPGLTEATDFAFINLHGSPGEDGLVQAMLDSLKYPYQGSGPAGSMLALDKAAAKVLFRRAGLPTPDWQLLTAKPSPEWQPRFDFPIFIKSNTGGSTLDMEKVLSREGLAPALDRLFAVNDAYIVEPAIPGFELTCGVLGEMENGREVTRALPPILIKPASSSGVFDYTSKYTPGCAEEICPAPVSPELTARIQELAVAAHDVLGLSGYSRSDFIVREGDSPVILEVNTLPGMTANSLVPREAATIGMPFEALLQRLIDLGLARHKAWHGPA